MVDIGKGLTNLLFHFIAGAFSDYGITTVLINYPLAPHVSMDEIVKSCTGAIKWISKNVESFNGNPDATIHCGT